MSHFASYFLLSLHHFLSSVSYFLSLSHFSFLAPYLLSSFKSRINLPFFIMNSFVFVYHSGKNTWSLLFEITSWTREFDSASWIRVHLSRPLQHKQDYNSPPVFFLEQHLQEKERHYKKAISGNRWRRGRVLSDKDKKDVWGLSLGGIFPLSSCLHRQHRVHRHREKEEKKLLLPHSLDFRHI